MENKEKKQRRNLASSGIYLIIPSIQKNKAKKAIQKKIGSIGEQLPFSDDMSILKEFESPERADLDLLKSMLEDNRHRMERMEDKAKVQIAGITIAISIIFGVAGNLKDIVHDSSYFKWVVFVVLLLSVIYMFSAGLNAINMLINNNTFHYLPSNISERDDGDKRRAYNAAIVKNQLQNTLRNNEISTSYIQMRNSIVLIIVDFVIWIIPIT